MTSFFYLFLAHHWDKKVLFLLLINIKDLFFIYAVVFICNNLQNELKMSEIMSLEEFKSQKE